jgi:hypothetical protein
MTDRTLDPKIVEEWRRRQRREFANLIPSGIGLIVILVISRTLRASYVGLPSWLFASAAFLIIAVSFLFAWVNWRCPACGKLPGHAMDPKFCSQCGVPLR